MSGFGEVDWSILGPAWAAGLLVLVTHVPLGVEVLRRGIVFIDLAIAQIATLGVLVAELFGVSAHGVILQVCAAGSALLGSAALLWAERRWPEVQEATIGVAFVLAASLGVVLVAHHPHGGEHLRDLLAGQILWVGRAELIYLAVLTLALVPPLTMARGSAARAVFYAVFALAVTASVQLVGVYLVFATLIVPALATRRLTGGRRLAVAYALGALGYALGLFASARFDLPSGAAVVWALAACGAAVFAVTAKGSPGR